MIRKLAQRLEVDGATPTKKVQADKLLNLLEQWVIAKTEEPKDDANYDVAWWENAGPTVLRWILAREAKLERESKAKLAEVDGKAKKFEEAIHAAEKKLQVISEALDAYEQLKKMTRGEKITQHTLHDFIDTLNIPAQAKTDLKKLTPENYLGLAISLAQRKI